MSPNSVLGKKIEKNMEIALAREKAREFTIHTKKYIDIVLANKNNSKQDKLNKMITVIRKLKQFFNKIPGFYNNINDNSVDICRKIRARFNQLTRKTNVVILTNSKMLNFKIIENLKICVPNGQKECCYMYLQTKNDNINTVFFEIGDLNSLIVL